MDPNETLEQLRRALWKWGNTPENAPDERQHVCAIVDLIGDLDGWLSKGGFLPDAWKTASTPEDAA